MSKRENNTGMDLTTMHDYDVGYGKPPAKSRFKPGLSGNPRGRPRGSRNKRPALNEERLKDIILDEAYREIAVRDGNRSVTVPMAQAVIRAMSVKAAKGDHRSQRLFAELLASTESANKRLHDDWLTTAITYKVEWDEELRRRSNLGINDLPDPLPHPNHVKIDMRQGTVQILGPLTLEEKAEFDWIVSRRDEFQDEFDWLEGQIASDVEPALKSILRDDLERTRNILSVIDNVIGPIDASGKGSQ